MRAYQVAMYSPLEIGDQVLTRPNHLGGNQLHVIVDIYHVQSMAQSKGWSVYELESGECVRLGSILCRIDPATGKCIDLKSEKVEIKEVKSA